MDKKINTLAELRAEKKKVKLEMAVTKRELAYSLGIVRTDLKKFLLRNVVLPAGAVGLTAYGIKKAVQSDGQDKDDQPQYVQHSSSNVLPWMSLVRLALTVVTSYFGGRTGAKSQLEEDDY